MLDAHTKSIVKQTAPQLVDKGLDVTLRMYKLMFTADPKVKSLFNMANQTPNGQPLALAQSIHAYAVNIDNLEALGPTVALIANKHASLGVKPEHYDIVGRNLLQAMQEVLNLNQEQVNAWAKAYQFLADLLISVEKDLYIQAASQEGGWEDYRTFVVDKKVKESDAITSFYLKPKKEGSKLASFKPGQYVTIKFDFPGGNVVTRNYSLSDAPNGEYYRISVRKERRHTRNITLPDGLVSCYLHDYYQPGMEVQLRAPMGDFFLSSDITRPVVLLSGGVGLTPVISMLKTIAEKHSNLQTYFIHGALNSYTHAFRKEVKALADGHENIHAFVCYSEPNDEDLQQHHCDKTGLITEEWLEQILPHKDCHYYFCGPKPFMQVVSQILKGWNIPSAQIHYEFFGPAADTDVLSSHSTLTCDAERQGQKPSLMNTQEQNYQKFPENQAKKVSTGCLFKRNDTTMFSRNNPSHFKQNYATRLTQNKSYRFFPPTKWGSRINVPSVLARKLSRFIPK